MTQKPRPKKKVSKPVGAIKKAKIAPKLAVAKKKAAKKPAFTEEISDLNMED